jgi:hypothetical protein
MENKQNYLKVVEKKLNTGDEKTVIDTLKEIRTKGDSQIVPLLFNVLRTSKWKSAKHEVVSLLSQVKDTKAVPAIINEVKHSNLGHYEASVLAALWESGLDYSEHGVVFAEKFINSNFSVALESFTVLEQSIPDMSDEDTRTCITLLKQHVAEIPKEKHELCMELIHMLSESINYQ